MKLTLLQPGTALPCDCACLKSPQVDIHSPYILTAMLLRMFEFSPIAIAITSSDGEAARYLKVNQAYLDLIGRSWSELSQERVADMAAVVDEDFVRRNRQLQDEGGYVGVPVNIRHADGRIISTLISAQRTVVDDIAYDLEIIVDVSERTRLQEAQAAALQAAACTDALSGLANRRGFDQYLEQRLAGADTGQITLALIDVDDFKQVNDAHGHSAGDSLIRTLGQRLRDRLGSEAFIARTGGDEFVVIAGAQLPEPLLRERIGQVFRPVTHAGKQLPINGSVGIARYRQGEGCDALLARADARMYAQKALLQSLR